MLEAVARLAEITRDASKREPPPPQQPVIMQPPRDDGAALRIKEMELQLKMMAEEAERRAAHERMMKVMSDVGWIRH